MSDRKRELIALCIGIALAVTAIVSIGRDWGSMPAGLIMLGGMLLLTIISFPVGRKTNG